MTSCRCGFSRRGGGLLHLLGALPRAASARHLRQAHLGRDDPRLPSAHLRQRRLLLPLHHRQPAALPHNVAQIPGGVQGHSRAVLSALAPRPRSRQSSLRYLDAEMARLHDSRRPLVVSFRRKKPTTPRKQVGDLQDALGALNAPETGLQVVEVHSLQPTHICPLTAGCGGRGRLVKSCTMPEMRDRLVDNFRMRRGESGDEFRKV